jgi:hypothetical protein
VREREVHEEKVREAEADTPKREPWFPVDGWSEDGHQGDHEAMSTPQQNTEQERRAATVQSGLPAAKAAMTEPAPERVAHLPITDVLIGSWNTSKERPQPGDAMNIPRLDER